MTPRDWLAVFAIGLGTAVIPLDSAVNIAFPDITRSFGIEIQQIQWVIIAYVLTHTSLMLFFGRLGDRVAAVEDAGNDDIRLVHDQPASFK